jgi:hypothetical protein
MSKNVKRRDGREVFSPVFYVLRRFARYLLDQEKP